MPLEDLMKAFKYIIFMSVAFLMLVSPLVVSAQQSNTSSEESCAKCHLTNTDRCEKGCSSFSGSEGGVSPHCVRGCVSSACLSACNGHSATSASRAGSQSSSFKGFSGNCGRCLRTQEFGQCSDTCSAKNSENPASCRRTCAKALCAESCQLPEEERNRKTKKITRHDCGKCKAGAQGYCSERCGKKGRAGYTACQVSCVEERCVGVCQAEPSDRSF